MLRGNDFTGALLVYFLALFSVDLSTSTSVSFLTDKDCVLLVSILGGFFAVDRNVSLSKAVSGCT